MARTRLLKPGFFQNEQLADLPMSARLLFAGLWTIADRAGRLEDRPKRIKALLFPFDPDVEMDDLLAGLCRGGFVRRYEAEQVAVIQIVRFLEHQKPHKNEPPSVLPRESKDSGQIPTLPPGLKDPVSRSGVKDRDNSSEADEPPSKPAAWVVFPCVGADKDWSLTGPQLQDWCELYPNLDIPAECSKALAWVLADSKRRKTASGMPRFLVNWFNRSADRGGSSVKPAHASYRPAAHEDYDRWPAECRRDHAGECGNFEAHRMRVFREQAASA